MNKTIIYATSLFILILFNLVVGMTFYKFKEGIDAPGYLTPEVITKILEANPGVAEFCPDQTITPKPPCYHINLNTVTYTVPDSTTQTEGGVAPVPTTKTTDTNGNVKLFEFTTDSTGKKTYYYIDAERKLIPTDIDNQVENEARNAWLRTAEGANGFHLVTPVTQDAGTYSATIKSDEKPYHTTDPQKDTEFEDMWILNASGQLVSVKNTGLGISGEILYNQPGSFRFGSSNYVPNYEDSIYLSRLTRLSTTAPVHNVAALKGGFCSKYANDPEMLENSCLSMDGDKCASTSCCVLLGGSKCVSGNEKGPTMKANYSDFTIMNRDFYYYQGKCYGNCM